MKLGFIRDYKYIYKLSLDVFLIFWEVPI